mmetsp:Transcript_15148/g.35948  ORF Transcript_15148/g.35948 Transcript_15148/m.35948 type:complete len:272 (-) Transcript_15148:747-1562(-)
MSSTTTTSHSATCSRTTRTCCPPSRPCAPPTSTPSASRRARCHSTTDGSCRARRRPRRSSQSSRRCCRRSRSRRPTSPSTLCTGSPTSPAPSPRPWAAPRSLSSSSRTPCSTPSFSPSACSTTWPCAPRQRSWRSTSRRPGRSGATQTARPWYPPSRAATQPSPRCASRYRRRRRTSRRRSWPPSTPWSRVSSGCCPRRWRARAYRASASTVALSSARQWWARPSWSTIRPPSSATYRPSTPCPPCAYSPRSTAEHASYGRCARRSTRTTR